MRLDRYVPGDCKPFVLKSVNCIYRKKKNQTMKSDQFIEYKIRDIFLEK